MSKRPRKPAGPSKPDLSTREFTSEESSAIHVHQVLMKYQEDKRLNYPNMTQLAKQAGVSRSNLYRIFDYMRDSWNMPIGPCPARGGGVGYTEPVTHFPLVALRQRQAAVLGLAQQLMALLEGTPLFDDFKDVLRKTMINLPGDFGKRFEQYRAAVSFHTIGQAAPAVFDWELFSTCITAVVEQAELELDHCSAKPGSQPKKIVVHPRHLANINHAWYLFFDVPGSDEAPIKYALTRIRSATRTGKRFVPHRPFDIEVELDPALGAFNSKKTELVHAQFSKEVAIFIHERKWHKKQLTKENADGTVDVKLNVSLTPELDAILLPFAGHMTVFSPAPLRERMREFGEALMRDHADPG
jgi:predicted DNA-binding transcriptional regulator YafY